MKRPYTGTTDGISPVKRPGLEHLVACIAYLSANKLWNNGTRVVRPMRNKTAVSVHATGRAVDLSYRKMPNGKGSSRQYALEWIDLIIKHADDFEVELLTDYAYTKGNGGGRTWKCDRASWLDNKRGVISGGGDPGSDWFHLEISPAMADSPAKVQAVVDRIVKELQADPIG